MNVKELRDRLAELPDDTLVVLSSDEEGNSYSTVRAVIENNVFMDEGYGRGYILLKELTDDLRRQGYTEEDTFGYIEDYNEETDDYEYRYAPDEYDDGLECVVLYP